MSQLIPYNALPIQVVSNKQITTDCIDVVFVNKGTSTAFINNYPLAPGETLPICGNIGEVYRDQIDIYFSAGATNNLWIWRRYYQGIN